MVAALVLLNVEHQHIQNVSQQLVDIQEVTEVYPVAGRYDLVAIYGFGNTPRLQTS